MEQFHIQNLDSPWLPAAFNPVSVVGVHDVSYDPSSNSLITSKSTSNGLSYQVTSYQYLSTVNSADLEIAPKLQNLSSLQKYLALPSNVNPQVIALAKQITAGKTTEYDKAIALQDYLLRPPFSYSLSPMFDGAGNTALYNFLFQTHQGYCQQFAGAYAVLARAAGLPTRLAVGFATGTADGNNTFQVLDSDAHTWPEVYFGSHYGWLPFEPTPGFANPGAGHYDNTAGTGEGSQSSGTGTHNTPHGPTGPTTTLPSGTTLPASVAAGSGGGHHSSGLGGWLPVLAILAAGAGWVALNVGSRRLRWALRRKRSGRTGADGQILSRGPNVGATGVARGVPPARRDLRRIRPPGRGRIREPGQGTTLRRRRRLGPPGPPGPPGRLRPPGRSERGRRSGGRGVAGACPAAALRRPAPDDGLAVFPPAGLAPHVPAGLIARRRVRPDRLPLVGHPPLFYL